jgi:hypothetical protein
VCDDAVWAILNTPPGGALRDRPEFFAAAALGAGANLFEIQIQNLKQIQNS